MSSSGPGGIIRNGIRHKTDNAIQVKTTWRGKARVPKNSRTARRYVIPATSSGIRKDGLPVPVVPREQNTSAANIMSPKP
jgi:hypothetical protein